MTHNGHSDDRYLGFTFETEKAIRVLTDLRDLGYDHVSIRQMLVIALSKIEHRQEKLERCRICLPNIDWPDRSQRDTAGTAQHWPKQSASA